MKKIPFNRPVFVGKELTYIQEAVCSGRISGDGAFTEKCHRLLEKKFNARKVLLTTSCTHALELASLLLDLKEGDEIIVPSFTFVSTVNAFMLRGAKPVFVDIRYDTKNIDENLIERKITKNTKAIFVVHYAGVACEMQKIIDIANRYKLFVVEDAAHAINAKYKNSYLGTLGTFGCYSFHETKNLICGEGGALVINDERFIERAEILREKGTNRAKFFRGEVDKYTWVDLGSSYLLSDVLAAFLYAQLEKMDEITNFRKKIYDRYLSAFKELEKEKEVELPIISLNSTSNYHIFYLLLSNESVRTEFIKYISERGVACVFHYVPLHTSPMGIKLGYKRGDLPVTEEVSKRLLRLPFYNDITEEEQDYVINHVKTCFIKKPALVF